MSSLYREEGIREGRRRERERRGRLFSSGKSEAKGDGREEQKEAVIPALWLIPMDLPGDLPPENETLTENSKGFKGDWIQSQGIKKRSGRMFFGLFKNAIPRRPEVEESEERKARFRALGCRSSCSRFQNSSGRGTSYLGSLSYNPGAQLTGLKKVPGRPLPRWLLESGTKGWLAASRGLC